MPIYDTVSTVYFRSKNLAVNLPLVASVNNILWTKYFLLEKINVIANCIVMIMLLFGTYREKKIYIKIIAKVDMNTFQNVTLS